MAKWIICQVCEGEGTTVNPNIDANGLTRDDFDDDPTFKEDYMSGVFDISCRACSGTGKMRPERMDELREAAAERRIAAQENGDFEGYCGAGDYRYGT